MGISINFEYDFLIPILILKVFTDSEKYKSYRLNLNKKVLTFTWGNVRKDWLQVLTDSN